MRIRLPVFEWLPRYRRQDLPRDLFAGLMGTVNTAPEAMAFALLAGLPAHMGLYSLALPLLVYFVLGTSRELSLSPTATLAALLAVTVAPVAGGDPSRYLSVAILVSWMLGAVLLAAGLLRLGYLANFVSRPVLNGYFAGAALLIAAAQLGSMLGVEAVGLDLPAIARALATSRAEMKPSSAGLGFGLLALLLFMRALKLQALGPALAVALGTLLVAVFGIETAVVGRIPAGLPQLTLPQLGGGAAAQVLLGVFAMSLLVFLDSSSVARHFADERGYAIDNDQEFLALGASNIAAGLTGAAPVSGNLTDTILLDEAGARSPLVGLVTVVLVLVLVVVGADLRNVPLVSFAAIVIYGVFRAPHLKRLREAWGFDRQEFWIGASCLLGVLAFGLIRGLLLAIGLTVLMLLSRASHMRVAEIGQVTQPEPTLVLRDRVSGAERLPGVLLFQPLGSLFFASARVVFGQVRARSREEAKDLRLVVLDLRVAPFVDLTACELLAGLERDLAARGVRLIVARANRGVEEKLRRSGLASRLLLPGGTAELLALLKLPPHVRDLT